MLNRCGTIFKLAKNAQFACEVMLSNTQLFLAHKIPFHILHSRCNGFLDANLLRNIYSSILFYIFISISYYEIFSFFSFFVFVLIPFTVFISIRCIYKVIPMCIYCFYSFNSNYLLIRHFKQRVLTRKTRSVLK